MQALCNRLNGNRLEKMEGNYEATIFISMFITLKVTEV
jgi:hypothetical protein